MKFSDLEIFDEERHVNDFFDTILIDDERVESDEDEKEQTAGKAGLSSRKW